MKESEKKRILRNSYSNIIYELPEIWSKSSEFAKELIETDIGQSLYTHFRFIWEKDKKYAKHIILSGGCIEYVIEFHFEFLWLEDEEFAREIIKEQGLAVIIYQFEFLFKVDKKLALDIAFKNINWTVSLIYTFEFLCPYLYYLSIYINREAVKYNKPYLYNKFKHILEK